MSSPAPFVSIGLPFRNAALTLRQAIESVQGQTFSDFELILLDDGSTDNSRKILQEFADERFRIVVDGQSLGLAHRLNQCIRLAQGTYFARMDADDIMFPKRLERQVREMLCDPTLDVVGTDALAIDHRSRLLGPYPSRDPSTDPWTVVREGIFIHPTIMGKIEWFRSNPYSERCYRAEDLELWTRSCSFSHFHVIHEPLLFYRLRAPWIIGPDWTSGFAADQLILTWGKDMGHVWRAKIYVLIRRMRRLLWAAGALSGLRWFKWQFRMLKYHNHSGFDEID